MKKMVGTAGIGKVERAVSSPEFDAEAVAREVALQTADVLRSVEALEDGRGPTDETLRTLICF